MAEIVEESNFEVEKWSRGITCDCKTVFEAKFKSLKVYPVYKMGSPYPVKESIFVICPNIDCQLIHEIKNDFLKKKKLEQELVDDIVGREYEGDEWINRYVINRELREYKMHDIKGPRYRRYYVKISNCDLYIYINKYLTREDKRRRRRSGCIIL